MASLDDFWSKQEPEKPAGNPASPAQPRFPAADPKAAAGKPAPAANGAGPVLQDFAAGVEEGAAAEETTHALDELLGFLLDLKGSDLHLKHGKPPMVRIRGAIKMMGNQPVLTGEDIDLMLRDQMTDEQELAFETKHELDFAYEIPGRSRFRVNVHRQRRHTGAVIRVIPNEIKNLAELGMPEVLNEFAAFPRGLVLVTGPTGSGKSTTLAAIIDQANRTRSDNIITIEDPIEFVHQDRKCIVVQREIGVDTESFSEALKRALRQDPDIILVGEMRDLETIQTAITAAETGHLVFGTLHTQSAATSMSRIIDVFPPGQQAQVQAQLAATLQAIVSQTLLPTLDKKGRVAAVEILRTSTGVRSMIRNGKTDQIASELQTGKAQGMQTLDMHLEQLVRDNKIAVDDALLKAADPRTMEKNLGGESGLLQIRRNQQYIGGSEKGAVPGSGNLSLR